MELQDELKFALSGYFETTNAWFSQLTPAKRGAVWFKYAFATAQFLGIYSLLFYKTKKKLFNSHCSQNLFFHQTLLQFIH
jgi:hypothetical protein